MSVRRWSAALVLLAGTALSAAPIGSADPQDVGGYDDSQEALAADPLPPPSDDLAGEKPPGDSMPPIDPGPFPDVDLIVGFYDSRRASDFFTASNEGVWFSTPLGLNCGIWDRGSFGCTGDIRGAPPGTTRVGWVNGNIVTRYDAFDPLLRFQFPPGRAEQPLPPRNYVDYNGTRCATMADGSTYCARGAFRFYLTADKTWLSPP